jgi:ribosomal protein L29
MAEKKTKITNSTSSVQAKKEVKELSKAGELKEQIKKAKTELFNLEMDQAQRKLKNTSSLTLKRKEIARLLTAVRLVELTNEKNA